MTSKGIRILAIAFSARGFGYCVMEDQNMLECGYKDVKKNKNVHPAAKIEKLLRYYVPDVLVLPDVKAEVKGHPRASRIKALHRKIVGLTAAQKCKVTLISGKSLRLSLLGNAKGTKHEIAGMIAQKFPELAPKLPPKRQAYDSENGRMDLFDAVGLAVVFWMTINLA
jgi:hypothetical protein